MSSRWSMRPTTQGMLPMRYEVGDYRRFAEVDYRQLEINKQHGFEPAESTCIHSQQYVEKMIKEKLVQFGQDPRFDHDLSVLLSLLSDAGVKISEDILMKASILSGYYLAARYPGTKKLEFGEETAEEAYNSAMEIVSFLDSID